jgi:hypothetical protein
MLFDNADFPDDCNPEDAAAEAYFIAAAVANGGLSPSFRRKFPPGTFRQPVKSARKPTPSRRISAPRRKMNVARQRRRRALTRRPARVASSDSDGPARANRALQKSSLRIVSPLSCGEAI